VDFKYKSLEMLLDVSKHTFTTFAARGAFCVVWHELVTFVEAIHLHEQLLQRQ
jgi:hypothetical protein